MANKKVNTKIKCDVESCEHNNCDEGYCELDEIKVGCTCDNDECEATEETVCESFKSSDDNSENENFDDNNQEEGKDITDTVYEVEAEKEEEN